MAVKHVVSTLFAILYSLCFLFVSWQLYGMARNRSKMLGFLAFFNYYTLAWAFCRAFYWAAFAQDAAVVTRDGFFSYFVFLLPLSLQYATFALLAVFLAKLVVDPAEWRDSIGARVWGLCLTGGAYSFLGTLTVSILVGVADPGYARYWLLGNALLFLLLGGAFLWLAQSSPACCSRRPPSPLSLQLSLLSLAAAASMTLLPSLAPWLWT